MYVFAFSFPYPRHIPGNLGPSSFLPLLPSITPQNERRERGAGGRLAASCDNINFYRVYLALVGLEYFYARVVSVPQSVFLSFFPFVVTTTIMGRR